MRAAFPVVPLYHFNRIDQQRFKVKYNAHLVMQILSLLNEAVRLQAEMTKIFLVGWL